MPDDKIDLSVGNIEENAKLDAELKLKEEEEMKKQAEIAAAELGDDPDKPTEKKDPPPEGVNEMAVANYNLLVEKGVLPEGLEVKDFEDIVKHIDAEKTKGIDEWRTELPEDINSNIEAWSKGVDYKKSQQRQQSVVQYDQITDDQLKDEAIAKALITEYHKALGDDDEYIKERINTAIDTDKLVAEAKRARNALKNTAEKVKTAAEEKEVAAKQVKVKEYTEYRNNLEGKIDDSTIFWDSKLTEIEKKRLKASIFNAEELQKKDKTFTPLEKALLDDPVIVAQIHYLYNKGALGAKGSFEFLKNKAKTAASIEIEKILKGEGVKYNDGAKGSIIEDQGMGVIAEISSNLKP